MPKFTRCAIQRPVGHACPGFVQQELFVTDHIIRASWQLPVSLLVPFDLFVIYENRGYKYRGVWKKSNTHLGVDQNTGLGLPGGETADAWYEVKDKKGELIARTAKVILTG